MMNFDLVWKFLISLVLGICVVLALSVIGIHEEIMAIKKDVCEQGFIHGAALNEAFRAMDKDCRVVSYGKIVFPDDLAFAENGNRIGKLK